MQKLMRAMRGGILFLLAISIGMGNLTIYVKATESTKITTKNTAQDDEKKAEVSLWSLQGLVGEELEHYDEMFRVKPTAVKNNGGQYSSSSIDKAWDEDRDSYWETGKPNSADFKNQVDVSFEKPETMSRFIYGARHDAWNKGFPNKFEIYSSQSESGEDFELVCSGEAVTTDSLIEIKFKETTFQRFRFVWVEAQEHYASARTLLFYKTDTLEQNVKGLFTDEACSSLRAGVSSADVKALQLQAQTYPIKGGIQPYLDMAAWLLSGSSQPRIHEPMKLSQRGDRNSERNRTATGMTLASFDLSGYYAIPGEEIEVFVDADGAGPMPRLVMAAVCQNTSWVYGYDGIELVNGYNKIKIPDTMQSAQAIYFYNPALPDQQRFAPTVRLLGGKKYPVYRYDANDSVATTKQKEKDFVKELKEYVDGVTDNYNDAKIGVGNYNIAEYVSDKILISVSARGALNSLDNTMTWNRGDFKEWEDKARFGELLKDETNTLIGIRYGGPAAVMECYEMLFDDIQVYSGFNNNDKTHPDYRNYGQFLFRAYNDGAGLGWGQSLYSGYNTGSQPNGSKWDTGFYEELVTVDTILSAGWAIFHEIGHVFDSGLIGTPESTNNLYGLMAQLKYTGTNRLADPGEDRWYNHFTNYINTGLLPQNDLLFYPGAVIYQLDAIDFSKTSIYQDVAAGDMLLSNYGRAGRYARLHRKELDGMSYTDRLVISFSMACGVDLSSHFEYYGRSISDEAKQMISGLPKEPRPTWIVNDRTFAGGAFDDADKAKSPVISSTKVDETTGAVTLELDSSVFTDKNLQTFSIYRREVDNSDQPLEAYEWIGITGEKKANGTEVNELYQFKDANVVPGKRYQYSVGAYDCTLQEVSGRGEVIVQIKEAASVPLSTLLINDGYEGTEISVGNTKDFKAVFAPVSTTMDLNSAYWWIEGYGRDYDKTGGGTDIITLVPDPKYPNDPTRRVIKGIQNGQTHIKVRVGGLEQEHRVVVNGQLSLDLNTYDFAFSKEQTTLTTGSKQKLNLKRIDKESNETINVETTPTNVIWRSKNTAVATTTNRGVVEAIAPGETEIEYVYVGSDKEIVYATAKVKVVATSVALSEIAITGPDTLSVGQIDQLSYSLLPNNTTETNIPTWTSSDDTIVKVDGTGKITAMKSGTATISASIDGITKTHTVNVANHIPLKSIKMNPGSVATLDEDTPTIQLSITKNPSTASGTAVTWVSSAPEVASVDENGLVSGVTSGTAVITASLEGKSATCTITVNKKTLLTGMKFRNAEEGNGIDVSLKVDESYQLIAYPVPLRASSLSATKWISSNPSVADVKDGYITAKAEGTAEITGTIIQNEGESDAVEKKVVCKLTVTSNAKALKNIGINHPSIGLEVGAEEKLTLSNQPTNANRGVDGISEIGEATWTSSDSSIVSVDADGNIKANKVGEASITATRGGASVVSQIVVHSANIEATSISLNKENISLKTSDGKGERLVATIEPTNATVGAYWQSSDPSIASVDQDGNVTPLKSGEATITAFVNDKSAECKVLVTVNGEVGDPDSEKPTAPSNLVVKDITSYSANVTWEASTDNIGITAYKVYVNDGVAQRVSATSLNLKLDGLRPATQYRIRVTALDQAGNESPEGTTKFVTLPVESAPNAPTNLRVSEISEALATLTWDAPEDAHDIKGYIIYRNGENVGEVLPDTKRFVLEGLLANTDYEVSITAYNASREESERITETFKTLSQTPAPDTEKPSTPGNVAVTSIKQDSGTLSWKASSDNVGVTGYIIYLNGTKLKEVKGTVLSTDITGLKAGTKYDVAVVAIDEAKNESERGSTTFTTLAQKPAVDTEKPSVPKNIKASEITKNSAVLKWEAASDNVKVVGYRIYVNGKKLKDSMGDACFTRIDDLHPGTKYEISISALDEAGNESQQGNLSFTTEGKDTEKDEEKPTTPQSVVISDVSDSSATISWTASSDNVGVYAYHIYANGTKIKEVKGDVLFTTIDELKEKQEYRIGVVAVDQAGNESYHGKATFTTKRKNPAEDLTKPLAPGNVSVKDIQATSGIISWNAPANSTNVIGYRIYVNGNLVEEVKATVTSTLLSGLKAGSNYQVVVTALTIAGIESEQASFSFMTKQYPASGGANVPQVPWDRIVDEVAKPSDVILNTNTFTQVDSKDTKLPQKLRVEELAGTTVTITWEEPSDMEDITGYIIYQNEVKLVELSADQRSYTLKNLQLSTAYEIAITAINSNKEESKKALLSFTTKDSDTQDNSGDKAIAATNVVVSEITTDGAIIRWNAGSGDSKVDAYCIYVNDQLVETLGAHVRSTTLKDLKAGTSYRVMVSAKDSTGKEVPSTVVEFTTQKASLPMSMVALLAGIAVAVIAGIGFCWYKISQNKKQKDNM